MANRLVSTCSLFYMQGWIVWFLQLDNFFLLANFCLLVCLVMCSGKPNQTKTIHFAHGLIDVKGPKIQDNSLIRYAYSNSKLYITVFYVTWWFNRLWFWTGITLLEDVWSLGQGFGLGVMWMIAEPSSGSDYCYLRVTLQVPYKKQ